MTRIGAEAIHRSVQKYIGQNYENQQTIEKITIIKQCGNVDISQEGLIRMWAKDMTNAVADIVMGSPEMQEYLQTIPPAPVASVAPQSEGTVAVRLLLTQVIQQLGPTGVQMIAGGFVLLVVLLVLWVVIRR